MTTSTLTTADKPRPLTLAAWLWLAGMPGVAAVMLQLLPRMLAGHVSGQQMQTVQMAATAQSAVLLALATWVGARCCRTVGLHAPVVEALIRRSPAAAARAFARQVGPGLVAGVAGALMLVAANRFAPPALQAMLQTTHGEVLARVLYGGITEELLIRWGCLSVLLWLARRVAPRAPDATAIVAIVASALLFGLGHLPAAMQLAGALTPAVLVIILLGNGLFGLVAGVLFWKRGLECAVLMHVLAHTFAALAGA